MKTNNRKEREEKISSHSSKRTNAKTKKNAANDSDNIKKKGNVPLKKKRRKPASTAPKSTLMSARRIDKIISSMDNFLKSQYLNFLAEMNTSELFPNPELALRRLNETRYSIQMFPRSTFRSTSEFIDKLKKDQFSTNQKILMLEWAAQICDKMEPIEGALFHEAAAIFRSHVVRLKPRELPETLTLSKIIDRTLINEFEKLPDTLDKLPPQKRAKWILDLMQQSNNAIKSISAEMPFVTETLNTLGNILISEMNRNHGQSK